MKKPLHYCRKNMHPRNKGLCGILDPSANAFIIKFVYDSYEDIYVGVVDAGYGWHNSMRLTKNVCPECLDLFRMEYL